MNKPKFRLFSISLNWKEMTNKFGILNVLWGYDIWFGEIPFIKSLLFVNILVWLLLN